MTWVFQNIGKIFLEVVNAGISSSWLILAVLLVRAFFRKLPKWIVVLLWGFAAVRLLVPLFPESVFSLIPSAETLPVSSIYNPDPVVSGNTFHFQINSGLPVIDETQLFFRMFPQPRLCGETSVCSAWSGLLGVRCCVYIHWSVFSA